MKRIIFQPVLDGVKRVVKPKQIRGYRFSVGRNNTIYYWSRGTIVYIFDNVTNEFMKFSLKECEYLDVMYNEAHKFLDIVQEV